MSIIKDIVMKKISIKKRKEFRDKVTKLITEMGATPVKVLNYEFAIDTPHCGKLYLSISDSFLTYTLFGNFLDDPETAKELFGHWKHNVHQSADADIDEVLDFIKYKLNYVIH